MKALETGAGGFADALLGLRKCQLAWALTAAPKYRSKEEEEGKGREDPR